MTTFCLMKKHGGRFASCVEIMSVLLPFPGVKARLKDPHSGLISVTETRRVNIPFIFASDCQKGVVNVLKSEVERYCERLGGVIVGLQKVESLNQTASISQDLPFFAVEVLVSFIVFKPEIGTLLRGVINKLSKKHIGCIVHGLFNVSASSINCNIRKKSLKVGSEVLIRVRSFEIHNKVAFIKGDLETHMTSFKDNWCPSQADIDHGYESEMHQSAFSSSSMDDSSDKTSEGSGVVTRPATSKGLPHPVDFAGTSIDKSFSGSSKVHAGRNRHSDDESDSLLTGSGGGEGGAVVSRKHSSGSHKRKKRSMEQVLETEQQHSDENSFRKKRKKKH